MNCPLTCRLNVTSLYKPSLDIKSPCGRLCPHSDNRIFTLWIMISDRLLVPIPFSFYLQRVLGMMTSSLGWLSTDVLHVRWICWKYNSESNFGLVRLWFVKHNSLVYLLTSRFRSFPRGTNHSQLKTSAVKMIYSLHVWALRPSRLQSNDWKTNLRRARQPRGEVVFVSWMGCLENRGVDCRSTE